MSVSISTAALQAFRLYFCILLTVQIKYGAAVTVSHAELRDAIGVLVPVYPSPADCQNGCYAILPKTGLQGATRYTAHVTGDVDGVPFDIIWSFTTKR